MRRIFLDDFNDGRETGIELVQLYGEYPGQEIVTYGIHYNTGDTPTDYPYCVVPNVGINYSFKKSMFIRVYNWDLFRQLTGAKSISELGIYQYEYDPYGLLYFGRNTYPRSQYVQASGTIAVSGNWCGDGMILANAFTKMNPYVIANGKFSKEFESDLFISQIKIPSDTQQGLYSFPLLRVTAVIE